MSSDTEKTAADKAAAKAAIDAREAEITQKETEANKDRTGKGTRVFFGMTRGRNPQMIQYENWDESKADTLPVSLSEFMDLRKITDEKDVVRRLILGDNEILYSEASDPIAEFVDASWPDEFQKQFRMVIRNYAAAAKVTIEDAVALLKPSIVAGLAPKA